MILRVHANIKPQVYLQFNLRVLFADNQPEDNQPMVEKIAPVGLLILDALKAKGCTQAWLAEQMDVSNTAVSKWIKKGTIARARISQLSGLIGVPVSDLIAATVSDEEAEDVELAAAREEARILARDALLVADLWLKLNDQRRDAVMEMLKSEIDHPEKVIKDVTDKNDKGENNPRQIDTRVGVATLGGGTNKEASDGKSEAGE